MTDKRPPKNAPAGKAGVKAKREWVQRYPDYPNLLDGRIGDTHARLQREASGFDDSPLEAQHEQYIEDCQLHWATRLKLFMDRVDANEPVEHWLLIDLREAFEKVLSGAVWEDSIALPGRDFKPEWYSLPPKEIRDRDLCYVVAYRVAYCDMGVEAACRELALERHLSYETVRAAYYRHRDEIRRIGPVDDDPSNFQQKIQKDF